MINELLYLLTDPAHWAFEGVTDLVFGGVGLLIGRFWLRGHDRKHHAQPTDATFVTYKGLTEILVQQERNRASMEQMRARRARR